MEPISKQKEVVSYDQLSRKYMGNQDTLCNDHEKLIGKALV
jgi:hypothetical protein